MRLFYAVGNQSGNIFIIPRLSSTSNCTALPRSGAGVNYETSQVKMTEKRTFDTRSTMNNGLLHKSGDWQGGVPPKSTPSLERDPLELLVRGF